MSRISTDVTLWIPLLYGHSTMSLKDSEVKTKKKNTAYEKC